MKKTIQIIMSLTLCIALLFGGVPTGAMNDTGAVGSVTAEASAVCAGALAAAKIKSGTTKSGSKTFYRVPKQSGYVYITDKITFTYNGKKVTNAKVKQSCDNTPLGYHKEKTKVDKAAKDGSVTVHSTYSTRECVTSWVSFITKVDIPYGAKYSLTYNYKIYPNGTVVQLKNSGGKLSIYKK